MYIEEVIAKWRNGWRGSIKNCASENGIFEVTEQGIEKILNRYTTYYLLNVNFKEALPEPVDFDAFSDNPLMCKESFDEALKPYMNTERRTNVEHNYATGGIITKEETAKIIQRIKNSEGYFISNELVEKLKEVLTLIKNTKSI